MRSPSLLLVCSSALLRLDAYTHAPVLRLKRWARTSPSSWLRLSVIEDDDADNKPAAPSLSSGNGGLQPPNADSFGEYLLLYAGLVALAFLLASAGFAALVFAG